MKTAVATLVLVALVAVPSGLATMETASPAVLDPHRTAVESTGGVLLAQAWSSIRLAGTHASACGAPVTSCSLGASRTASSNPGSGRHVVHAGVNNSNGQQGAASPALRLLPPISPATWLNVTSVLPNAPSCRDDSETVYDAADRYVLLFGGTATSCGNLTGSSNSLYNDTWSFVNGTWTNLSSSLVGNVAPPGRWGGSVAYDAKDGYVVLFGGLDTNDNPLGDTWTYAHRSWKELTAANGSLLPGPAARWRMSLTYDAADQYVVGFGGATAYCFCNLMNDTWSFVGGAWSQVNTSGQTVPSAREGPGLAFDALDGYTVLFGGGVAGIVGLNDSWSYLAGNWTQLSPTSSPPTRWLMPMAYDPTQDAVVVYGGTVHQGGYGSENDTWAFAGGQWVNISTRSGSAPPPLGAVRMTFDPIDNYTLLFGGSESPAPSQYNTTWVFATHALFASASIAPATVDANQTFVVHTRAVGTVPPFTYRYAGLPAACSSANVSRLNCTPGSAGRFSILANVSDPKGDNDSIPLTIVVAQGLRVPGLSADPAAFDLGGRLTVNASGAGGVPPYAYRYAGLPYGCFGPYSGPGFSCVPTRSGWWNLTVQVTDANGVNASSSPVAVHVLPQLVASASTNRSSVDVDRPVRYTAVVAGGSGGYAYAWSGLPAGCTAGNVSNFTCVPTLTGVVTSALSVTDAEGTTVVARRFTLIVNPPPTLSVEVGPAEGLLPLSVAINLTENFGTLPYSVGYDFGDGITLAVNGSTAHTYGAAGAYTLRVTLTDSGGDRAFANRTVRAYGPLTASLAATPGTLTAGQRLTLTAGRLGGTGVYSETWQGLPVGCTGANTTTVTCRPHGFGTFVPSVSVRDSFGQFVRVSTSVVIYPGLNVTANATPLAACGSPFPVQLGSVIAGGRAPIVLSWGFGDGASGSGSSPLHAYASTGPYTVVVTARDADNATANATVSLTVAAFGPCGSSATGRGANGLLVWAVVGVVLLVAAAGLGVALLRRRRGPSRDPVETTERYEPPAEQDGVVLSDAEASDRLEPPTN